MQPPEPEYLNVQLLAIQNTLGSLDAKVTGLQEEMRKVCSVNGEVSKIAQDFLAYKAARQNLPDRLSGVEKLASDTSVDLKRHCDATKWIGERVAKTDLWLKAALLLWSGVAALIGLLIFIHKNLGITFTLK